MAYKKPVYRVQMDEREVSKALHSLVPPGELFEIRIIDEGWISSGYFTDVELAIQELKKTLITENAGVYVTLNHIKSACGSRKQRDKFKENAKPTTSDKDIDYYQYLMIDFDPERVSGVSASDEELREAHSVAESVVDFLRGKGWPEPLQGLSGNGYHALYWIENLPASDKRDDPNTILIKKVLEALNQQFGTARCKVDEVNFNPARVCKLYGTMAQKGENTPDRPHRLSKLINIPEDISQVTRRQLEDVAALWTDPKSTGGKSETIKTKTGELKVHTTGKRNSYGIDDLGAWMDDHGIDYSAPVEYEGGLKYILKQCAFDPAHTGTEAAVFVTADGTYGYRCQHDSCKDYHFQDFVRKVDPDRIAQYVSGKGEKKSKAGTDYRDIVLDLMEAAKIQQFGKALYRIVDDKYYKVLGDIFINHELIAVRGMEPEKQKAAQTMIRSFQKEENVKYDPYYVGFRNGIMNWRTCEFTPYGEMDVPIFRYFDVNYNPNADTAFIDGIITDWCQGDEIKKEMLYELAGCCLYSDKPIKKWWAIEGKADTGKTTFLNLLKTVIGEDNVGSTPIQKLKDSNAIAELIDKSVNIVDDGSSKFATDLSPLRRIIQGDYIQVKLLYQNLFTVRLESRMIFVFNKTPRFRDDNDATAKKMLVIGFNRVYADEEKDTSLVEKLTTEENKEAFVCLAVERMKNVLSRNLTFTVSEESKRITSQIIQESDQFVSFTADTLSDDYDWRLFLGEKRTSDVYETFYTWAKAEGYQNVITRRMFTDRCLAESGAKTRKSHGNTFYTFRE